MHPLPPAATPALAPWEPGVFAFGIFVALTLVLVGAILVLIVLPRYRRGDPETARPYECGVIPTGHARFRYPAPFWLVAVFFLIFDVEAVYIVSWAISFERLDWTGFARIAFFIVLLLAGLMWLWRKGGLEWAVIPRR